MDKQIQLDIGIPFYDYKSPLVYPGGKSKAVKRFNALLPQGVKTIVSTFLGGGAIELYCAAKGIQVIASDNFEPLTNFWNHFLQDADGVIDKALSAFPLNREQRDYYYRSGLLPRLNNYDGTQYSEQERAALFLLMNRQSFRGWTLAYSHGGSYNEGTANVELFDRLRHWKNDNITVSHCDYKQAIEKHEGTFMYFDPPYVDKEQCYGWCLDKTPKFDHVKFKDDIAKLNNRWILSYLKHDLIMELYKDYEIIEYEHKFVISYNSKETNQTVDPSTELFILNL